MAMAPYVDIFVLQVQRVQTEPETVRDFVLSMVQGLRQANPDIQVSVQVRTEGDVIALTALLDSMKDSLEGVSILTSPETTDVAQALVGELRPPLPVESAPGKPAVVEPARLPAETLKPRRTPVIVAPAAPPAAEPIALGDWAIRLGALVAGVVVLGGMAATAFVHALRSWRQR
jgi:cell division septation protein DedD